MKTPSNRKLRTFIANSFSDSALDAFCFDYFPEVKNDFASGFSKNDKAVALIEYCKNRQLTSDLLVKLERERPSAFQKTFFPEQQSAASQTQNKQQHANSSPSSKIIEQLKTTPVWMRWGSLILALILIIGSGYAIFSNGKSNVTDLTPTTLTAEASPTSSKQPTETATTVPVTQKAETPTETPFPHDARCGLNDTITSACLIGDTEVIDEDFVPVDNNRKDVDYFKLWIKPNISYACETFNLSSVNDTKITLYNADEERFNPSVENDDKEPIDRGSKVEYLSTYTGWLYILVEPVLLPAYEQSPLYTYQVQCIATLITPTPTPTSVSAQITPAPSPAPAAGDTQERPADGATMVFVPGGTFAMGSDNGDNDEQPVHTVTVDYFWIDQTEVTNESYAICVDAGDCAESSYANNGDFNGDRQPVVGVSWYDAETYCTWANGRLPTEAEWEYAARGPQENIYPWGNASPNCDFLNYRSCIGKTTLVGEYSPAGDSWVKAADMAGSVWEWVQDWYNSDYYANSPSDNPTGAENGSFKVLRGGSWSSSVASLTRSSDRYNLTPTTEDHNIGFRCAFNN